MKIAIPEPENKNPILMSEGVWRPTPHTYSRTVPCTLPELADADSRSGNGAHEHLFTCDESGVERRFGTVDPDWHKRVSKAA